MEEFRALLDQYFWPFLCIMAVLILSTYIRWPIAFFAAKTFALEARHCIASFGMALSLFGQQALLNYFLVMVWDADKYKIRVDKLQRKRDKMIEDNVWAGLVQPEDGERNAIDEEALNELRARNRSSIVESVVSSGSSVGRARGKKRKNKIKS